MLLAEHHSKELIAQYGVPIPEGYVAGTAEEAKEKAQCIDAGRYVVKAQISVGGRGLAGGIKFAATPTAVAQEASRLLGSRLVTEQTGPKGEAVEAVYVEAAKNIARDYFIAIVLDPTTGAPLLLASREGGIAFEERARMDADTVKSHSLVDCGEALDAFLADLGVNDTKAREAILSAYRAFIDHDMLLLEINPFARTADGEWLAVDAKVALDRNALFRHPEHEALLGARALTGTEAEAAKSEINLVKLDGDIGVVVNGAGLGLATNDMLVDAGGWPANFMDIRTTAKSFDIARGVELLLRDQNVKAILLNVHGGGMTTCDTVAEGVAFAYSRNSRQLPVAVRLAGQNAEWGLRILKDRRVPIEVFNDMTSAVIHAVTLAKGSR